MSAAASVDVPRAPAIRCRDLRKRYDDVVAVDGLDLEVRAGECFGLLGPNGAGKTTTIEIFEGLVEPTSGEVELLGLRWDRDERALRSRLGISLQETNLQPRLSVRETLLLFRSFYARGRDVDSVLALVSLEDKQHAWYQTLSGGQKQRVAVACALVGDPDLLFLDEPTTGLDPQSRRQLWDIIVAYRASGGTVLLTTHYMDEAERLCDRVAVVDRGKIIALGPPRDLIASLGGSEVIEFAAEGETATDELAKLAGVISARTQGGGFALTVSQVHIAVPAILEHLTARATPLTALSTRHVTLEDVFIHLTGRQLRD